MQRLLMLGINHTTAPLELRERIAFDADGQRKAIEAFRARFAESEFALISTCNRVELYTACAAHGRPNGEEILEFLAEFHSISPAELKRHVYEKSRHDVVEHLFNVAASLDSMVLGETQILGQVRDAYELARSSAATGTMLNPMFQRALAAGKQVMSETALGDGRLSIASVAIDYAKRIFDQFKNKAVLCIGAGKITQLALRQFAELGTGQLMVCNRDATKAVHLARQYAGEPVAFENLAEHLVSADIVISSTASPSPIIGRAEFEEVLKRRRYRPIFLIDLAVPRDIDASIGELEHVYLYNLDDLQDVVSRTQAKRTDAIVAARALVRRHVDEFAKWQRAHELGPAIDTLYKRYHLAAQDELARTLNKLPDVSDEQRAHLEDLARRIVNKLLHDPVKSLREADNSHGPGMQYLHAMEKLFRLDEQSEI